MTKEELEKVLFEYYCKYYSLCRYLEEYNIHIDEGDLEAIEYEMREDLEEEWDDLIEKNEPLDS